MCSDHHSSCRRAWASLWEASYPISHVTIDSAASSIIKLQYWHSTHKAAAPVVTANPKGKKPYPCHHKWAGKCCASMLFRWLSTVHSAGDVYRVWHSKSQHKQCSTCYFPFNFRMLKQGKVKEEAKRPSNRCVLVSLACWSLTVLPAAWAVFMQRGLLVTPSNSTAWS